MMKYKGYVGHVTYDDEAKIFHGDVLGLRDVITFEGTNVQEIEQAFRDSVDFYLNWCKDQGEKPEKPYSGKFTLRMPPDMHANLAIEAIQRNMSITDLVLEKIRK